LDILASLWEPVAFILQQPVHIVNMLEIVLVARVFNQCNVPIAYHLEDTNLSCGDTSWAFGEAPNELIQEIL
jgi:hypothetical protein